MSGNKVNVTSVFNKRGAEEDLSSALRKEIYPLKINFQECDIQDKASGIVSMHLPKANCANSV